MHVQFLQDRCMTVAMLQILMFLLSSYASGLMLNFMIKFCSVLFCSVLMLINLTQYTIWITSKHACFFEHLRLPCVYRCVG